jgi:ABC-type multidrug transport system fused ATPase/permease subunit
MSEEEKEKSKFIKINRDSIRKAKRIFRYLRPYRWLFLLGWVFLVLTSLVSLAFPLLMGQLLGSGSTQVSSMHDVLSRIQIDNVNAIVIGMFIMFGTQALFSFLRVVIFTNVTENALRDLRKDAFQRLVYMPMDFFNEHKVGELTSRLSADITKIQDTLRTTIAEFFRQFIVIIGGVALLFYFSWKLSLIMLATVPVMAIVAVLFGRFIRKLSRQAQDESAKSNSVIEESLMGISNVKSFTNELFMLGKYKSSIDEIRRLNIKSGLWRGVFVSFIILCLFGAIVFIIWQGVLMTQGPNPELAQQDLITFILYTVMMGASFGSLPDLYATIQRAIGSTEHLMDIMSIDTEKDVLSGTEKPEIKGAVRFEHVSFYYPQRKDVQVLRDIDFTVKENQTIALVGSSGAGKSTITSLLLNYYPLESGNIFFDDVNTKEIDVEHLRSNMAIVPQEVILFSGSIRENIAFGNVDANEDQIIEAAKQANAWDFINSFPEKLETQVGDRGIQLSGGQKQRIAIARAILNDPAILILDEATSSLDSESEKLVQDALEKLMTGRTSFVIAHRLSTIKNADKIFVLDKGQIAETGTHDELIQQEGIYTKLVKLQALATE